MSQDYQGRSREHIKSMFGTGNLAGVLFLLALAASALYAAFHYISG
jgi:hypothetical protein